MRPPMQTAALQQNEEIRHQQHSQQQHSQQQQQQQQQQRFPTATRQTLLQSSSIAADRKSKLQQHDFLVENHLNHVCSAAASNIPITALPPARFTYQQQQKQLPEREDSLQLVDLSTSPPSVQSSFGQRHHPEPYSLPKRSSVISQFSRSSSSDEGSLSGERYQTHLVHTGNSFDDAAEHFVINFPAADSPSHNQNDSIINLPLSETEPLLTNIEATIADRQRSICLNKNSASLIFTRKELPPRSSAANKLIRPSSSSVAINNNCATTGTNQFVNTNQPSQTSLRRHHHSLRNGDSNRKKTKHLPPTYHQQQRRSLQLNYNNNLVTTSTCSTNNNHCCTATSGSSSSGSLAAIKGGASLHKHHHSGLISPVATTPTTAATTRKQHAYSWYAPVYSALEEELEQDSRESSPIHNLANTKKPHTTHHFQQRSSHNSSSTPPDNETVALLETRNKINIQAQLHVQNQKDQLQLQEPQGRQQHQRRVNSVTLAPNSLQLQNPHNVSTKSIGRSSGDFSSAATLSNYDVEGPHAGSLGLAGGPLPRRRRFENFLKSLVGLKSSSSGRSSASGSHTFTIGSEAAIPNGNHLQLPASPEITITRTPSDQNVDVVMRDPAGRPYEETLQTGEKLTNGNAPGSTLSLNTVQQKLRNIMRREGSAASLHQEMSHSIVQYTGLRKCETVLALTRQTNSLCSPVLGAGPGIVGGCNSGSAASMRHNGSGIFSANGVEQIRPLNRLRNSVISVNATCSRCSSLLSLAASGSRYSLNAGANGGAGGFVPTSTSQHHLHGLPPMSPRHHRPPKPRTLSHGETPTAGRDFFCKSSAGAHSSQSTSSISPPSNVTTATLNSSLTPTSPTPTPTLTPTNTPAAPISHQPPTASVSYPPAVASLFSLSSDEEERDFVDGTAPKSTARRHKNKHHHHHNHHHQHQQQHQQQQEGQQQEQQQEQQQSPQEGPQEQQSPVVSPAHPFQMFTCKLCLIDVESTDEATTLLQCGCQFCTECMKAYVEFEITEGAYEISCPDAQCPAQGSITLPEIANLTTANLMKKHHRYRLNREIELDRSRTWCPRAGCETVCLICPSPHVVEAATPGVAGAVATTSTASPASEGVTPALCAVLCPSCKDEFCSACKKTWHPNVSCEENSRRLVADGQDDIGIPFDNDLIKCCPMCAVPIEKDEGCAQMMCKRCKHVFCWYCLASLDDDFLLRHYDKGPCKNKLGHSRASVVWHRAQVIGIFAGFGILLLVASPLLLLAAPCIICCKCRSCSGSKMDEGDADLDEATALQS